MRASDAAHQELREAIIGWRLLPGTHLGEVELAERLGVSRTPVREALSRLQAEGLVTAEGPRSLRVAMVTEDDVQRLYQVREALEIQAARLAARHSPPGVFEELSAALAKADDKDAYDLADQLDQAVMEAANNHYLTEVRRGLNGHLERLRRHASINPERLRQATAEHRTIADAIGAGDEFLAVYAVGVHLHNSLADLSRTLAGLPA